MLRMLNAIFNVQYRGRGYARKLRNNRICVPTNSRYNGVSRYMENTVIGEVFA